MKFNKFYREDRIPFHMEGLTVYKVPQIREGELRQVIEKAQNMWLDACRKYIDMFGDTGSAVSGNGIFIALKPPKKRSVYKYCICYPLGIGIGPALATVDPVLKFLHKNGVECWYGIGKTT